MLERLGARRRRSTATSYTLDEFVEELVLPNADLLAVQVHKRRQRYTIGGCMTELTDLANGRGDDAHGRGRVGGRGPRDRDRPRASASRSFPNTSFPRGLKALAGLRRRSATR